jgi:Ni,Fe-hydrogenase maturation factor
LQKTLILGYGNPDRQDDGIAWHILDAVARKFNYPLPDSWEEGFQPSVENPQLELSFSLQLVPEMAEVISTFNRVCFVDAHTGRVPDEVHFEEVTAEMQNSPFTHHMTPSTLIFLSKSLYRAVPAAFLLSVRGYEFGFSHLLSKKTSLLLGTAVDRLVHWYSQ